MRLLLSNTLGPASTSQRSQAGQASSAVPLSQRPQIGPILVLCYTNHALDSFLEGLVDAGEAEWGAMVVSQVTWQQAIAGQMASMLDETCMYEDAWQAI